MEKKMSCLVLLCFILQCPVTDSSRLEKQRESLRCLNDFYVNLTCTWNSSIMPGAQECEVHAHKITTYPQAYRYSNSCKLQPYDSRKERMRCLMTFKKKNVFMSTDKVNVTLSCPRMNQSFSMVYVPYNHIKLNPPTELSINVSTVSWLSQIKRHYRIEDRDCELQWKPEDQSWSSSSVGIKTTRCNRGKGVRDEAELDDQDELIRGEKYDIRVRVKGGPHNSTWSEWSPVVSWISTVGNERPTASLPPPDATILTQWWVIVSGAAAVCSVALILFWSGKNKWVYILKKVSGPPLPDPGKSFLKDLNFQQESVSPYFSTESFQTILRPVEIMGHVKFVSPLTIMEKLLGEQSLESRKSSFCNPSYTQVCSSPPPAVTVGDLAPCLADSPYGQVQNDKGEWNESIRHNEDAGFPPKQVRDDAMESGQVRDLSPKTHFDVQRLLAGGTGGGILGSERIQLCSGYKPVPCQPDDPMELPSLDSGLGCEGDDFHPPQPPSPPCILLGVEGLSPTQKMQMLVQRAALSGTVASTDDGYKAIRQQD